MSSSLVVVKRGAGSVNDEAEDRLRKAFPRATLIEFHKKTDLVELAGPRGRIIVAGGDGTVAKVARQALGKEVRLGIVPLGTFNNFARSLGIPENLTSALRIIRAGRTRRLTAGLVNGHPFLEAAALGLFGETIVLGQKAKKLRFGEFFDALGDLTGARPFDYRIAGDLDGQGHGMSLVFANTRTTGPHLKLADRRPTDAYLELSAHLGSTRTALAGQFLRSALGRGDEASLLTLRFRRIRVETRPRVLIYADNRKLSRTPATVEAWPRALRVFVPS